MTVIKNKKNRKINEKFLWGFDAGGTKTVEVWDYTR